MIDIYIVHNDPTFESKIKAVPVKNTPYLHFLDEGSKFDKKQSFQLKSDWGAKLTPFALILDNDNPIKAFYSEADNVLECLIKYLKDYDRSKCNQ